MSLFPFGKQKKLVMVQTVWCSLPFTVCVNVVQTCNKHGGNKKAYTVLGRKPQGT